MLGDDEGNVLTVDPRVPNQILYKVKVANRSIRNFCFNGTKQFGVTAENNKVEFFETNENGSFDKIHQHSAPCVIYSICCDPHDKKSFYVVGEKRYGEKITLPAV